MKNIVFCNGKVSRKKRSNRDYINKPISKGAIKELRFLKDVILCNSRDADTFIEQFGWNENLKIGSLYGFGYLANSFRLVKCRILKLYIYLPNILKSLDISVFDNVKCICFTNPVQQPSDSELIDYMYNLHNRGILLHISCSYNMHNISSHAIIRNGYNILNYNRDAEELDISGVEQENLGEIFGHFTNVRKLRISLVAIHLNANFYHSNLNNLSSVLISIHKNRDISEITKKSLCDLLESNKNLYVFMCHPINTELLDSITVDAFRGHHNLRGVSPRSLNQKLKEARRIDREVRYRYIKVAAE